MKNMKVYVHGGGGKLGEAILSVLIENKIAVSPYICSRSPGEVKQIGGQKLETVSFERIIELWGSAYFSQPTHIFVCTSGDVLEEQIDDLLSLQTPLVICSTQYDEQMIADKAESAGVLVLFASNLAVGIVDFWKRLDKIPDFPQGALVEFESIESHQQGKADISGTFVRSVEKLEKKGFDTLLDIDKIKSLYSSENGVKVEGFESIRKPKRQLDCFENIEEHLTGHGFHSYHLIPENKSGKDWCYKVFFILKTLEGHSQSGIIDFVVEKHKDEIEITHNVYGRSIYGYGAMKVLEFLRNKSEGIFYIEDLF